MGSVAAGILTGKVGNLTSAVALEVTLMGLLSKTERKRRAYETGIRELCRLILLALDKAGVLGIINVADGADVTGSNAPQAHEGTHVSGGSDDIDSVLASIAIALTTRGDMVYQGASGLTRRAKGNLNDVLTMGANDPAWAAPAGGGAAVTLSNTEVFNGALAVNNAWEDLDLSGVVGSNVALVLLGIVDLTGTIRFGVRTNGDTDDYEFGGLEAAGCANAYFSAATNYSALLVTTDATGKIEMNSTDASDTHVIDVISYIA